MTLLFMPCSWFLKNTSADLACFFQDKCKAYVIHLDGDTIFIVDDSLWWYHIMSYAIHSLRNVI